MDGLCLPGSWQALFLALRTFLRLSSLRTWPSRAMAACMPTVSELSVNQADLTLDVHQGLWAPVAARLLDVFRQPVRANENFDQSHFLHLVATANL